MKLSVIVLEKMTQKILTQRIINMWVSNLIQMIIYLYRKNKKWVI